MFQISSPAMAATMPKFHLRKFISSDFNFSFFVCNVKISAVHIYSELENIVVQREDVF